MQSRYKKSGWYGESHRHSLARNGIKTGRKDYIRGGLADYVPLSHFNKKQLEKGIKVEMEHTNNPKIAREIATDHLQEFPLYYTNLAKMEAGMKKDMKVDYSRIDFSMMNKVQAFLHKKFNKAVPEHLEDDPAIIKAREDIENIDHPSKIKEWFKRHKLVLELIGLGSASLIIGNVAGVPTLMQNTTTGEIVSVGGTLIGRTGLILGTVLHGIGVGEEAKVISKEVYDEGNVKLSEVAVDSPEQNIFIIKSNKKKSMIDTNSKRDAPTNNESLSEISSSPIPYSQLSSVERSILSTAVKKVKSLLHKKGKDIHFNENNLQVVERVGHDNTAYGAHQDGIIQISRNTLKNPDKTEGVLAHEAIHAVYDVRDETRDLENLHIDYLGLAM